MTLSGHSKTSVCKIVYVIGALNVGGAERHLVDVAPALAAQGYRITIRCLTERGVLAGSLANTGVEVLGPPLEGAALTWLGPLGRYVKFVASNIGLWGLLLRRRPTIVHCFLPMSNIVGIILGKLSFIPCIVATRRSLNRYQERRPVSGWVERRLNRHADAIVSNSHAAARELVDDEGASAERIAVIHNGIPLSRMTASGDRSGVRDALGIGQDTLVFIIVANLIGYKGHLDLVAALAGISGSLPDRWKLLVVGRDDGLGAPILQASQDAKIERHVRLLGARNDIAQLLQAADIAVLSSHEEGFPTSILEYMAAGLPVVATDVGGAGEAVRDGETGYLVPANDPQSLGTALLRLANSSDERRRLGDAGHTRLREQFTLETCVAAYHRFYRQLVADRTKS